MKNRRGISEIMGAVIAMAIVVAGLGLYTTLAEQRILGETFSAKEILQLSKNQKSELIDFIQMYRNDTQPEVIEVYVFNSGLRNVTISNIFVNGTIDMQNDITNPVYVRDLNGFVVSPNNKTIPQGTTSRIVLNFTGSGITSDLDNFVIRTDSNKLIQILNDTK